MNVKTLYHFQKYVINLTVERDSEKQNSISIAVTTNEKSYTIVSKYKCYLTEALITIDVASDENSFSLTLSEEAPELKDWILKFNLKNGDNFATFSYGGEALCVTKQKNLY